MHGEFLKVEGGRMGKSEGNFITLSEIKERGFHPITYRYFVLTAHYRTQLNFTWKNLEAASNTYNGLKLKVRTLLKPGSDKKAETKKLNEFLKEFGEEFRKAINDDLQTPQALAALHEAIGKILKLHTKHPFGKRSVNKIKNVLEDADKTLGLDLTKSPKIPRKVEKLAKKREKLRSNQQFVQSDSLRKKIRELGYEIEDTPIGPIVYANKTAATGFRSRDVGAGSTDAGQ